MTTDEGREATGLIDAADRLTPLPLKSMREPQLEPADHCYTILADYGENGGGWGPVAVGVPWLRDATPVVYTGSDANAVAALKESAAAHADKSGLTTRLVRFSKVDEYEEFVPSAERPHYSRLLASLQPLEGTIKGETLDGYLLNLPGLETSLATADKHIHKLPCGCVVIVALRLDNNEGFVASEACSAHGEALHRATERWADSAGKHDAPEGDKDTGEVLLDFLREEIAR